MKIINIIIIVYFEIGYIIIYSDGGRACEPSELGPRLGRVILSRARYWSQLY